MQKESARTVDEEAADERTKTDDRPSRSHARSRWMVALGPASIDSDLDCDRLIDRLTEGRCLGPCQPKGVQPNRSNGALLSLISFGRARTVPWLPLSVQAIPAPKLTKPPEPTTQPQGLLCMQTRTMTTTRRLTSMRVRSVGNNGRPIDPSIVTYIYVHTYSRRHGPGVIRAHPPGCLSWRPGGGGADRGRGRPAARGGF